LALGFTLPKRMSAIALPVSLPPYHFHILVGIEGEAGRKEGLTAWTIALTDDAHGISTGVPDCMTTTVEGFAAATAEMRAFM
jgi:hypothetical protein